MLGPTYPAADGGRASRSLRDRLPARQPGNQPRGERLAVAGPAARDRQTGSGQHDEALTYEFCAFSDCGGLAGLTHELGATGFGVGVAFDVSLEIDIPWI